MSKNGDIVIAWIQMSNQGTPEIATRTYLAHTAKFYPEFSVTRSPSLWSFDMFNVAMDSSGSANVSWVFQDSDPAIGNQINIRKYNVTDPTQPGVWELGGTISPLYPDSIIGNLTVNNDLNDNIIASWTVKGNGNQLLVSNVFSKKLDKWLDIPKVLHNTVIGTISDVKFREDIYGNLELYWFENGSHMNVYSDGAWGEPKLISDLPLTFDKFIVEDPTGAKLETWKEGDQIFTRSFE